MARLIIIGIDGMDPLVVEQLWSRLPHLRSIMARHQYRRCHSVFPPDSIPAWATIYTGAHPSIHGWLDNVDYEDIRRRASAYEVQRLEGHTFWDVAGAQGRRVCVINPLLAYPVWPVNGIMINGPVFVTGAIQSYPPAVACSRSVPQLGGMVDMPRQQELAAFAARTREATLDLAAFGLELYQVEPWDLFFISFLTLDRLQHFLWRFYDANDPTHPGPSPLEGAIPDLYQDFDDIVGQFIQRAGPDTTLLVLSDHGHGQRPLLHFNVNELLRRGGLLHTSEQAGIVAPKRWVEVAKNTTLRWLADHGQEELAYSIARLIPSRSRKALKKSGFLVDRAASVAWASEMGGGSSVGGVEINPSLKAGGTREYSAARERIVCLLEAYGSSSSSEPVMRWVKSGAELAGLGGHCHYPDIVFRLDDRYAVGHGLFSDICSRNPRHLRVSGGHRPEGVCFVRGDAPPPPASLLDVYPFILATLGCRIPAGQPVVLERLSP